MQYYIKRSVWSGHRCAQEVIDDMALFITSTQKYYMFYIDDSNYNY